MFLCGGIPFDYYEHFQGRARKQMREHYFAGCPLYTDSSRSYRITKQHIDDLFDTLTAEVRARPNCLENGLGVIFLLRPWENGDGLFEAFFPFALCTLVYADNRSLQSGARVSSVANDQISDIFAAAKNLIAPCRILTTELRSRRKRTPLLLPVRHFDSDSLFGLLRNLWTNLKNQPNPKQYLRDQCVEFEKKFPFEKSGKRSGRFVNGKRVSFVAPGRALHGRQWNVDDTGHNAECHFNAALRLGGGSSTNIHYDCTRGRGSYSGNFKNCHDQSQYYKGSPHLNVYSNDFIR